MGLFGGFFLLKYQTSFLKRIFFNLVLLILKMSKKKKKTQMSEILIAAKAARDRDMGAQHIGLPASVYVYRVP